MLSRFLLFGGCTLATLSLVLALRFGRMRRLVKLAVVGDVAVLCAAALEFWPAGINVSTFIHAFTLTVWTGLLIVHLKWLRDSDDDDDKRKRRRRKRRVRMPRLSLRILRPVSQA